MRQNRITSYNVCYTKLLRKSSSSHSKLISTAQMPGYTGAANLAMPVEVKVGGATVFVLDVERFEKY